MIDEPAFKPGEPVLVTVKWQDGTVRQHEGTLEFIRGEHAYVRTSLGVVEGDAETLEPA